MKAEYISHLGTDLSAVNAARVSMDKESHWKEHEEGNLLEHDIKLIHYLAKNRHDSCFEHQAVTMRLKVPLFVRSQIHRHRTFSYNEVSRRYVKDNLEFYWPEKWRKAAANVKQGSSDETIANIPMKVHQSLIDPPVYEQTNIRTIAENIQSVMLFTYNSMIEGGVCAEQARMILPQNLYTQFYMTGNLRNWCHFLKLRLDPHAQKEVRDCAQQCADIIKPLFPVSYEALMQ